MAPILLLLVLFMPALQITGAQSAGVCYGRNGNNLPSDTEVVDLYKSNGIGRMRIYEPNQATLEALRGSNIELMVTILNNNLQALTDAAAATDWVQKNVQPYSADVKFKYIAVGNEVHPDAAEAKYLLPAIQNIQNAVTAANLQGQIKVSTAIDTTFLLPDFVLPSNGAFSDAANSFITPIITFLSNNGAPLLVNIYPYFAYIGDPVNIKLEYALFTSPGVELQDGSNGYQNIFDALLDTHYSALEKAGAPNMAIVVSESGWPSEGGDAATTGNAGTYYSKLINHVKTGTPKRPNGAIETYLFAMFDENLKDGAEVEKHFGIFSPNKQPKYQLTFG
ncbi:PREDICTED: glucan endo-1,3-beta-glucosidase-like [Fragaria vesca subsp. vesca]|uniref:glucan endo-1,3-beta-glucosidase-like n=1 Tax=Fragaria vesca subsp. vesca TaxID=101020 RepID=UPI0002C357F7|nr:PREDICTED: glucan endo-1,3-beta-glucosidase-like [Fragaria vesca subsp. vesca]